MTKEQLRKNWRRGFAVALTAAMVVNSTLPATTFAAEFTAPDELVQTLPENETENTQAQDESTAFGDGEESTAVEDVFSTGTENAFSAQTSEKELSEAVKDLQERINALPTAEEFQAMADGTTVEDSTLNQKQTDVYNEAQAIADALDQLSEEEQGQVDTARLEALFEAINSEVDLLASSECAWGSTSDKLNNNALTLDNLFRKISQTKGDYYVKLLQNVAMKGNGTDSWEIGTGRNVYIDLNGHKLSSALEDKDGTIINPLFTIRGGKLVITDSSEGKTGTLDGTNHARTIKVDSNGKFILEGGTITKTIKGTKKGDNDGNLIYLGNNSTFIMNGGKISMGSNAVKCVNMQGDLNCTFIMNGGEITGNTIEVDRNGCVIDIWAAGSFEMNNGKIYGNVTKGSGGAISTHGSKKFTINLNGGEISNNKAELYGGAIYVDNSNAEIHLNGTKIKGNESNSRGGAIYCSNSDGSSNAIYMTAGEISNNKAGETGGGIYDPQLLVMTGGTIKENEAQSDGGGVRLFNGNTFVMTGGTIEGNKSGSSNSSGGGISDSGIFKIGGTASVINNVNASGAASNIYLNGQNTFTILSKNDNVGVGDIGTMAEDWSGRASVKTSTITKNTHRKITTNGTTDDLEKIISDRSECQVGYDASGYLYLFNHTHEWTYSGKDNVVTANCSVNTDPCNYHENGLKLTITAKDMEYSGEPYSSDQYIDIDNEITNITKANQGAIQYFAVSENGEKTGAAISAPSDVGTYIAEVSIGGATAADKFEITKKIPEVIAPTASNPIYNGELQEIIHAGSATGGAKMQYKLDGTEEWSNEIPKAKDAGSYTIWYRVVGNENYADVEGKSFTVTIEKKGVVVSGITAKDKTYDGNTGATLKFDGVKFEGLLEEDSLSVTAAGTFENKNAGEKKVLISNLTLEGASAKNYVLAKDGQQSKTSATINAKEITATITPNGGTYEGTITPATAVLNGLIGNEKPEVTLTYTGTANDGTEANGNMPTHAGTYTVTASITDNNYSLKPEGVSAEFVISKADPALSVSAIADKNYGGEAFELKTSNKGGGQKTYTSSDKKVVTVDENGLVTIVGAGEAILTVSIAESANYTEGKKTVTVTVKKVDHKLVVEKEEYTVTYGDPEFKIVADPGDKETDIKFSSNKKDVASVDANGIVTVGNVGTAKITVSMDESQNYVPVAKEVTVTVMAKKVTVTPFDTEKHVGFKDPKLTYKTTGLVNGEELTGVVLTRQAGEEPGDYEITAKIKTDANPNYNVESKTGKFTINDHAWPKKWTVVREATAWSEGKEEKQCTYKDAENKQCGQKKYESIPKKGEEDTSNGNLQKDAEVAPDAPIESAFISNSKKELLDSAIFNENEKKAISNGSNAKIWIEITAIDANTGLSESEKAAIKKEADKLTGKDSDIVYFNADLFKQVGNETKIQMNEQLGTKIKLTILIPDKLLNHQSNTIRDYKIIRMHNGNAEVLSGTFNSSTKEFTFETDKFSTYAISYKDTYYAPSYPVTGVTVSPEKATLTKEGETVQLKETITPSYADNKNVTWTSSDEKVATVDKNGKVTAVSNGTAVITVTSADGKYTAKTTITVKIAPEKLTLKAEKTTLTKIGDSLQITAKVEPDNAYKKLIWKSSDEKVAIVDADGKVTAVGIGTATITATTEDGKLTESVTITVKIPDEPTVNETTGYGRLKARSVTQTNNSIKLEWTRVSGADGYIIYGNYCNGNGKTYKYNKITTITNGKTRTWTHTKLKKATYYKYIVKAYKLVNGKKVITDTSVSVHATTTGGKYGVAKAVSITKIGNKKNVREVTLKRGKTAQITAAEIKKDRPIKHHRNICYESSNTKVAAVTPDGMIQAKGKGTCTIWVYAQNGVYKTVTVTVK